MKSAFMLVRCDTPCRLPYETDPYHGRQNGDLRNNSSTSTPSKHFSYVNVYYSFVIYVYLISRVMVHLVDDGGLYGYVHRTHDKSAPQTQHPLLQDHPVGPASRQGGLLEAGNLSAHIFFILADVKYGLFANYNDSPGSS